MKPVSLCRTNSGMAATFELDALAFAQLFQFLVIGAVIRTAADSQEHVGRHRLDELMDALVRDQSAHVKNAVARRPFRRQPEKSAVDATLDDLDRGLGVKEGGAVIGITNNSIGHLEPVGVDTDSARGAAVIGQADRLALQLANPEGDLAGPHGRLMNMNEISIRQSCWQFPRQDI